jgi:hypothetical protein
VLLGGGLALGPARVSSGAAGVGGAWAGGRMIHLELFVYLQLLDFLTTWIGLRLGLAEASPFIRHLMQFGPAAGLAASKLLALALAGLSVWLNRRNVVRWINYWYAALVVWNMALIAKVLNAG